MGWLRPWLPATASFYSPRLLTESALRYVTPRKSHILKTTSKNNGVVISNQSKCIVVTNGPYLPGHLLSFRPKQLAANAHDETSRSVIITPILGLKMWTNALPSGRQNKNLACERGCKTSNPRSEYNERTSINCHKYNPGNNIWVLNENKLYFIHKISVAWALSFRNNVATMLQRCAVLQTVKMSFFR